jgi:hypothetical protein
MGGIDLLQSATAGDVAGCRVHEDDLTVSPGSSSNSVFWNDKQVFVEELSHLNRTSVEITAGLCHLNRDLTAHLAFAAGHDGEGFG